MEALGASPMADAQLTRALRQEAFQRLRPVCARLLMLRGDAGALASALGDLTAAATACSPAGLRMCWDYVMFPLLILLDAAAAAREPPRGTAAAAAAAAAAQGGGRASSGAEGGGVDDSGGAGEGGLEALPAARSDAVLEGLLGVVCGVQLRCGCREADQLLPVLQHVLRVALLPRKAASEEARLIALQCIPPLVQPPAAAPPGAPSLVAMGGATPGDAPGTASPTAHAAAADDTPPLLSDESMAPLAGALIHACISAADAEVQAGGRGSKAVRAAALAALRALIAAVGTAEALSFFLPGIASGLSAQLLASSGGGGQRAGGVVGAAASAAATAEALRALADGVCIALGDASTRGIVSGDARVARVLRSASHGAGGAAAAESTPPTSLEEAMTQLALAAGGGGNGAATAAAGRPEAERGAAPGDAAAAAGGAAPRPGRLHVERTGEWVLASAGKVQTVLAVSLTPLMTHPRPSVRLALAQCVTRLLGSCSVALAPCSQALLEMVLTLAQDEWPQVAQACVSWLAAQSGAPALEPAAHATPPGDPPPAWAGAHVGSGAAPGAAGATRALTALLPGLCRGLLPAVRGGDAQAELHAKRLTTALLFAGAGEASRCLLQRHALLEELVAGLHEAFALDPSGAAVLLHTRAPQGSYGEVAPRAQPPAPDGGAADGAAGQRPGGAAPGAAAVLLPRMPLLLAHLGSARSYRAVAGVARALGRLARAADTQRGAAGADLQRLLDMALSRAHQVAQVAAAPSRAPSPAPAAPGGRSWRCECAAAVSVATEVLFGASPAWRPEGAAQPPAAAPSPASGPAGPPGGGGGGGDGRAPDVGPPDAEFERRVLCLVEFVTREPLWGVPTSAPEAAPQQEPPPPSAQERGENVLLLLTLMDAAGAAARMLQRAFTGRVLRCALMPLLERLGDPTPLVAEAAETALRSICLHAGYADAPAPPHAAPPSADALDAEAASPADDDGAAGGGGAGVVPLPTAYGLQALVAANADYIVDGVCRQLRALPQHPRAPHLLAALLRKAGVGPTLLPLLAEPAGAALKGLSILSRRQQPEHVHPFLHALLEVAAGAGSEARAVDAEATALVSGLRQRYEAHAKALEERERAATAAAEAAAEEASGGGFDEARAYFTRLAEEVGRREAQPSGADLGEELDPEGQAELAAAAAAQEARKLRLAPAEHAALQRVYRRAYAAAMLASGAADAAAPLMLSAQLRAAVLSADVASEALRALRCTTAALDLERAVYEEMAHPPSQIQPARPDAPKLLPAVHQLWTPLVATLRSDPRPGLLERTLQLLGECVRLGGGQFMARRFTREAWPLLQRMARGGPVASRAPSRPGQAPATSKDLLQMEYGQGEAGAGGTGAAPGRGGSASDRGALAPASVHRVQAAAMACVEGVCACEGTAVAARTIAWDIATTAAPFLSDAQPPVLREAAAKLLLAVARVDADGVWLLLTQLVCGCPGAAAAAAPRVVPEPAEAKALGLEPMRRLLEPKLPPPPGPALNTGRGDARGGSSGASRSAGSAAGSEPGQGFVVTPQLAAACGKRAAALLPIVEQLPVAWHQRAPVPAREEEEL